MSKYAGEPGYQAYRFLQIAFILFLVVLGADKFFYGLADWSKYLPATALTLVNGNDKLLNGILGGIEIVVGVGLLFRPHFFAYFVSLWLAFVIVTLFFAGHFFDATVRTFALFLSSVALVKLSRQYRED